MESGQSPVHSQTELRDSAALLESDLGQDFRQYTSIVEVHDADIEEKTQPDADGDIKDEPLNVTAENEEVEVEVEPYQRKGFETRSRPENNTSSHGELPCDLSGTQSGMHVLQRELESYMAKENEREQVLLVELEHLMAFYGLWTAMPSQHEENRAFKRLRTRAVFVGKKAQKVNEKRLQYTRVRQAFTQALDLLANH